MAIHEFSDWRFVYGIHQPMLEFSRYFDERSYIPLCGCMCSVLSNLQSQLDQHINLGKYPTGLQMN